MYPHQLERLTGVLESAGLDALVATTPANIAYVTGFRSLVQEVYGTGQLAVFTRRGTALVVPAIDLAAIVVDGVEVDHVRCYGGFVSSYAEPADAASQRIRALADARAASPADALAEALAALDAPGGRIGVDEGHVTPQAWERLAGRLRPATLAPAADRFLEARRIKSPHEIEMLARALGVAEEAANAVVQMLGPGVTEREAAAVYDAEVVKRGALPAGRIVAFGERAAIPAPRASERALRAGNVVRLDLGCALGGFHAEVARTAVMGQPDARLERACAAVEAGVAGRAVSVATSAASSAMV